MYAEIAAENRFLGMRTTAEKKIVNGEPQSWNLSVAVDGAAYHTDITLFKHTGETVGEGTAIGIRRRKGGAGQLVPYGGKYFDGQTLNTDLDRDDAHWDIRLWKPLSVGRGWQFQYLLNTALFLGVSAEGFPILSSTPVTWKILLQEIPL